MKGAKDGKFENVKAETTGSCMRHTYMKGGSGICQTMQIESMDIYHEDE